MPPADPIPPVPPPTPPPAPAPVVPEPVPPPAPVAETVEQLKARLDREQKDRQEANREAQNLRKRLHDIEEKQKQDAAALLAEQGKFKELYEKQTSDRAAELKELTELRTLKKEIDDEVAADRKAREDKLAADLAALPEDVRKLVPSDVALESKELFLAGLRAQNPGAPAPRPPTTPAPPGGKRTFTVAEIEAMTFSEREKAGDEIRAAMKEGRIKA